MQEEFCCGVHGHGLSLIGTPITSPDNERTGVILQVPDNCSDAVY